MKKEFTRKELIHSAVQEIRITLKCIEDEHEKGYGYDNIKVRRFKWNCDSYTFMLENLNIISFSDSVLLREIISREYSKILERKYEKLLGNT